MYKYSLRFMINAWTIVIIVNNFRRGYCNETTTQKVAEPEVLFNNPRMKTVILRRLNETTGELSDFSLTLDEAELSERNFSINELENQMMLRDKDGTFYIDVPGKEKLPILLQVEEVISFQGTKGNKAFAISKQGFMSRTVQDLKDDPSLKPSKPPNPTWPQETSNCTETSFVVRLTKDSASIRTQNRTIAERKINDSESMVSNQGIFLIVINPSTCRVIFEKVFKTFDFGFYRDLIWILESVQPGMLIVQASIRAASIHINEARSKMESLGSTWAKYFLFRDGWLTAFVSGGKFLTETLVPNFVGYNSSASPYDVEFLLSIPSSTDCFSNWPSGTEWEMRKLFCESNAGYGSLCDCSQPFSLQSNHQSKNNSSTTEEVVHIALLIQAGNRTRSLFRLIESVGNQKGVWKKSFLVYTDTDFETTIQLLYILGLNVVFHRTISTDGIGRIASNLQFGLLQALQKFPSTEYFVVLEDDLILAPDFYAYMSHLSPIFKMDPSVFCVSAFNHLSYPHTSKDPSQIYRVATYPAYGWMLPRELVEFIIPKFLPGNVKQDWDFFIGSDLITDHREILVPDINRSYHFGIGGVHNKGSIPAEELYLSRTLNNHTNVAYATLESLVKDNYEREFLNKLRKAKHTNVKMDLSAFDVKFKKDEVYKTFVRKINGSDQIGFQLIAEMLHLWTLDDREHHNHAWRFNYLGATVFVIGIPMSPYSKYLENGKNYLSPGPEETMDNHYNDVYGQVNIFSHFANGKMPNNFFTGQD